MAKIPLEDYYEDIVGKAQRGLGLSNSQITQQAGISEAELDAALGGAFDETVARKVAPVLGLGADQLVACGQKSWEPEDPEPIEGLACFNTPFTDMTVNAYLVWDPNTQRAIAFDTGADCGGMLETIRELGVQVDLILLTHTHTDHIIDLTRLKRETGAKAYVGQDEQFDEAEPFAAGQSFSAGGLQVETRRTSGHARGGITYVIHGLARDLAIVGDAVFAGSMGGGMVSYADALQTNRESILTLPDSTVLCPGHGPLTTVGEEKRHNPFFTA